MLERNTGTNQLVYKSMCQQTKYIYIYIYILNIYIRQKSSNNPSNIYIFIRTSVDAGFVFNTIYGAGNNINRIQWKDTKIINVWSSEFTK